MSGYKLKPKSIVDELAQFIRQVDGSNRMGAGALAEKICERFRVDTPAVQAEPVAWYLPSEEGYDSRFRDHATVKSCTGNTWAGWQPLYTAPQPAEQQSDVTQLVEALETIVSHHDEYFRDSGTESKMPWIKQARAALAAYHNKGGEMC